MPPPGPLIVYGRCIRILTINKNIQAQKEWKSGNNEPYRRTFIIRFHAADIFQKNGMVMGAAEIFVLVIYPVIGEGEVSAAGSEDDVFCWEECEHGGMVLVGMKVGKGKEGMLRQTV